GKVAGWFLKHSDLSICLLLATVAALICLPTLVHVFPNGDDIAQHYWWTTEFTKELRDGEFYPQWLSGAYAGQGSPVMFYYPPLPLYFSAFFNLLGRDPLGAIALSCWLALALSGMSMYALSRSLLSRSQSLIAAAFYITVHYHLFDLYQRCAINEFWAFVWIPLVLHATYLVASGRGRYRAVYLAVSYGLLLLTHLPSTLVVSSVLPIVVLIQTREIKRLIVAAASAVLGAGMAGIYVSSVLFETGYLAAIRGTSRPRYRDAFLLEHLVTAFQTVPLPSNGVFAQFVLFSDWLASVFLILLMISTLVIWKTKKASFRQSRLLIAIWVAAVVSFLMTTRLSSPLWLVIPRLRVIQFPIRWFVITSVGASLLVAVSFAVLGSTRRSLPGSVALAVAVTINLAVSALVIARAPYQPEALQARLAYYTDVLEYHPQWWDKKKLPKFENAAIVANGGDAGFVSIDETGTSQSYDVDASTTTAVQFRTLYFPGWTARVDGQITEISPSKEGHIQLTLEPGEHRLTLDLEDTIPRRAGKIISALSLLAVLSMIFVARRTRVGDRNESEPQTNPQGGQSTVRKRSNRAGAAKRGKTEPNA
ncbi:MAG TPA: 6-pyruvoyl-tetrahydropterin synthase-related protein, partial [Blastocatellia bacterium]|nr:6-pyruvoyl-tetrahydropterin synthase-related protein [Blastocatellia bacterium]